MSKLAKNLLIFNEVYKQASFREATKSIGVSLATISRAISELESDCRMKLFVQIGGKYEPTRAGDRLFDSINSYNQEVTSKYEAFKRHHCFLTVYLPQQFSGEGLVRLMAKYNQDFDTNLSIFESAHYNSRAEAYSDMSNGKLDILIDVVENSSNSFISTCVKSAEVYLIGNSQYYASLDASSVTENSKFVKMSWLGDEGGLPKNIFGIDSELQVGYITQNINSYYNVISKTNFLGFCPDASIDILKRDGSFSISSKPVSKVPIYLITTKAAWHHKEIVSWITSNIESEYITLSLPLNTNV